MTSIELTQNIINLIGLIDQLKKDIYQEKLRVDLLLKLCYDHGVLPKDDLDANWESYLWNEVGCPNVSGKMKGLVKVGSY